MGWDQPQAATVRALVWQGRCRGSNPQGDLPRQLERNADGLLGFGVWGLGLEVSGMTLP